MSNLHKIALTIINDFNNKIELQKREIDEERIKINLDIGTMINKNPNLLKMASYSNNKEQVGGLKLTKSSIDTLDKLNQLFERLQTINPDKIEEQNRILQQKSKEIIELLKTITGDVYTNKSVSDIVVNQNLLQKLDLIKTDIQSFGNTLQIQPQLGSLNVPLKTVPVEKLLNTTALNELLKKIKKQFDEIKSRPAGETLDTDIQALNKSITDKIKEINDIAAQINAINQEYGNQEELFMDTLQLKDVEIKLQKVESEHEFVRILIEKFKESSGSELFNKLKDIVTETFRFKNPANKEDYTADKINTYDEYIFTYDKYFSQDNIKCRISNYLKFERLYNDIIKYIPAGELKISDAIKKKLSIHSDVLPNPLFDGTETKTISNNIFKNSRPALSALNSIKNLVKINLIDPAKKELDVKEFKDIYNPTFTQTGGTIQDLEQLMMLFNNVAREYRKEYVKYVRNTEMQNKFGIYHLMHSVYLLMIINSNLFTNGDYKIYKFIGRGMINFYRRIIDKLYKDLHAAPESIEEKNKPIIMEIRKKYYLTIVKLKKFLDKVVQQLTPFDKIDIDRCSDKVQENFVILNHFKTILEKYNETFMNKLTIYGRINDIKMDKIDDKTSISDINLHTYDNINTEDATKLTAKKSSDEYRKSVIFTMANKLFISDYERRNIYAGYYLLTESKINQNIKLFDKTTNKLIETEIPLFPAYDAPNGFTDQSYQKIYDEIKMLLNSDKPYQDIILDLERIKKEKISPKVKQSIEENIDKIKHLNKIKETKAELEDLIEMRKAEFDGIMSNATLNDSQKKKKIEEYRNKSGVTKLHEEYNKTVQDLSNPANSEDNINKIKLDIDRISQSINLAISIILLQSSTVDEKIMWARNYTCEANKQTCDEGSRQTHPTKKLIGDTTLSNCPFKTDRNKIPIPILKNYKFTEVFDSQNFANNADMTSYMCLNTRLSGGNSVCLITYGYSGTGKSYTLFGKQDDSGTVQGLLQSTLGKLDQLDKVYFRLFEIYGKGIPYPDYWYKLDNKKQINKDNIYNYLYAYKLQIDNSIKEKIRVEKPNIISQEDVGKEFAVKLEKKEINDYIELSNQANLSTAKYELIKSDKKDSLRYLEIEGGDVKNIFESFDTFTTKIETMRIKKQRVRETPNNNVSSRSILIYDFVLMIKVEGVQKPVNFLIIDLPGREEIAPTFINKYVDEKTNPIIYDIIKNKSNNKVGVDKIIKTTDSYMKELKLMLACFTLNPIAVPIFSVKILEDLIKTQFDKFNSIINGKENIEYELTETIDRVPDGNKLKLSGNFSLLDEFISYNYDYRHLLIHDGEKNITKLLSEDIRAKLKNQDIPIPYYFRYKKELIDSGLGWLTLRNYIDIDSEGNIKLHAKRDESGPYKLLPGIVSWKDQFNSFTYNYIKENENETENMYSNKINDILSKRPGNPLNGNYAARDKLYGLNVDMYNGRQVKILFFMYLIKRIIRQGRFDLLDLIYEKIIEEKINKLIKEHIDVLNDRDLIKLINNLISNNFKAEALKNKFIKSEIINSDNKTFNKTGDKIEIKYDDIDENGNLNKNIIKQVKPKEYIYDSIKYDFYTTGFEGIYINENIIGLIKYLGKDGKLDSQGNMKYLIDNKADRELISILQQNPKLILDYQIKISRLLMMSRLKEEGEQSIIESAENYNIITYVNNLLASIAPGQKEGIAVIQQQIAVNRAKGQEAEGTADKPNYTDKGKKRFFKIKGDTNIPHQIYKKDTKGETYGDYYYDDTHLEEAFNLFNDSYQSSKIFCYDNPIIKTILEPYLLKINDFKIFYLFGNYTKETRELKCAQQFELLETTNNFIEAITR